MHDRTIDASAVGLVTLSWHRQLRNSALLKRAASRRLTTCTVLSALERGPAVQFFATCISLCGMHAHVRVIILLAAMAGLLSRYLQLPAEARVQRGVLTSLQVRSSREGAQKAIASGPWRRCRRERGAGLSVGRGRSCMAPWSCLRGPSCSWAPVRTRRLLCTWTRWKSKVRVYC